jgi:hypothetical protein
MSLNSTATRLSAVPRELWAQWESTKDYWTDDKARQFEHKYIEEVLASVDRAVSVIEKADKLLNKIRKDCE